MRSREQHALVQLVRDVSRRQVAPRAEQHERAGTFPADLFALLAELDLLGLPFPPQDGGGGHPTTVVCDVLVELSRAFVPLGLATSAHLLATAVVAANAAPRLRGDVLPRLIAGEWLASCALPPSTLASHPPGVVRAQRDGDAYVLDGTTSSVSHAGQADCYVLFCAVGDEPADQPTVLLVFADVDGLECSEATSGVPASTGALVCRGVRVPIGHRLDDADGGQPIADDVLAVHRLGVAACTVGLARAALHAAVTCVRNQASTADARALAAEAAHLASSVEAADALVQRVAAARDAGRSTSTLSAMAAVVATDTAMRIADAAVRIDARTGSLSVHPVERYRREATAVRRVEHAGDGSLPTIARDVVGEPG